MKTKKQSQTTFDEKGQTNKQLDLCQECKIIYLTGRTLNKTVCNGRQENWFKTITGGEMGLKMISPLRVIFLHLPRNLLDSRKQDLLKEGLMSLGVKGNHTTLPSFNLVREWYWSVRKLRIFFELQNPLEIG